MEIGFLKAIKIAQVNRCWGIIVSCITGIDLLSNVEALPPIMSYTQVLSNPHWLNLIAFTAVSEAFISTFKPWINMEFFKLGKVSILSQKIQTVTRINSSPIRSILLFPLMGIGYVKQWSHRLPISNVDIVTQCVDITDIHTEWEKGWRSFLDPTPQGRAQISILV